MDGVSAAASIIAVIQITGTVLRYLAGVKGASKEHEKIFNELSPVYHILLMLGDQADAENQSWNDTLHSLNLPNGPLRQLHVALETLATKLAPAEGLIKVGKILTWPFHEKETKDILATIERQKGLFLLARQNDHIELTKAIHEGVQDTRKKIDVIDTGIAQMQLSQSHNNIRRWLSAPDPSTNRRNALNRRHPKTGVWLTESPVYLHWRAEAGSLLWLHGIPGCGKTVLSSTVLQNVLDHSRFTPKAAVLYFYFDFNDSEKQRHEKMIRSLIHQILEYDTNIPVVLDSLFTSCGSGSRQPDYDGLLATLHQMLTVFGDIYIILDALDECNDRSELLEDIEKFLGWTDVKLHLLTTSRREIDIEKTLQPLCDEETRICIQAAAVNKDIRSYVHDRLQTDRRLKRWQNQPTVQREIENELMEKAGGMFRWAVCQLDALAKCLTIRQLRLELKSLPKDLDGTYERILCSIDELYSADTLKILQWLAFSAQPLTLEEVAEVVTINVEGNPRVDHELRLDPRDILTICSSLITIGNGPILDELEDEYSDGGLSERNHSNYNFSKDEMINTRVNLVRLAHFSVKEFLVSDRIRRSKAVRFGIHEVDANGIIAEDCLAYLLQFDSVDLFGPLQADDGEAFGPSVSLTPKDQDKFPLALYAAQYWPTHARIAQESDAETASILSLELLLGKGAERYNWIRLLKDPFRILDTNAHLHFISKYDIMDYMSDSPVHCASLLGLAKVTSLLLDKGFHVEGKTKRGLTFSPLCAACDGGHARVVEILLNKGADSNFDNGGDLGSALHVAAELGNEETVQLLLKNGADVNTQGGLFGNALQAASYRGHVGLVRTLIEKGADVNAQGGKYGSALQAASYRGDVGLVRTLIEKCADVNAQGGKYGSTLQAASYSGPVGLVRTLIEKGADVNAQGGEYGSALQAASYRGDVDLVQTLIENGADINAQGEYFGSALQAASYSGPVGLVRTLIEKGADVNAQGGKYGSALQAASYRGNVGLVRTLIEKGADVNAQGGKYGSALQAASYSGPVGLVRTLIEKGADVNAQGGEYGSALQAASYRGDVDLVQTLIENGADINAQGKYFGSALQAASYRGHIDLVRTLIENGADVNTQGGEYGSALQAASYRGHIGLLRTLIENGADVNAQGGYYGNALQAASRYGYSEVVQLPLQKGAIVNTYGGSRGTALEASTREGHDEVTAILLAHGAKSLDILRSEGEDAALEDVKHLWDD